MRIDQINLAPIEFQTILEYESVIRVNNHGYARIVGYVNAEQKDKATALLASDVWAVISGSSESGEVCPIFCGLVTNVQIQVEDDTYVVTVELKTGTILLDMQEHIRVYQGSDTSYSTVLRGVLQGYYANECIMALPDKTIGSMIVQYRETDWEFSKRVASREKTVLIPNEKSVGVKYTFGVEAGGSQEIVSYESYQIVQNIESYQKKLRNGIAGIQEKDEVGYIISSREFFYVGDGVEFAGESWIVAEVMRTWKKKELWNQYVLKSNTGMKQPTYYNKYIIGASLQGLVESVEGDKVTITVTEDENKNAAGRRTFDYATVYSSPDGTGWYCMPEVDDCIQLQFPDERESHAYVSSSVNVDSPGMDGRSDANQKSIKNMYGKEILFTPDMLVMTNNDGTSITISDAEGILLESDKNITIKAKDGIEVVSVEQSLDMLAAQGLSLQQNNVALELSDTISMSGSQVNMQ